MNKRRITRGMILVGSAVALVATPLWIVAQQQPPTPPAAAIAPALTPPVSQPVAATTQVEIPTTGPVAMLPKNNHVATTQISVRFKDAPIDSVLQYLSQAAGYAVIKESPIDLRVTMWKDQPMPPEEAVSMLNTLLLPSGYTAVVQGVQGKVLKITSREKAKKGSIPVFVGVDPNAIPLTDDLRTQVIPLKSVDAIKLKVDLQPLVGTDADLTCNAASNSLMITDTAANIHRVVEIVARPGQNPGDGERHHRPALELRRCDVDGEADHGYLPAPGEPAGESAPRPACPIFWSRRTRRPRRRKQSAGGERPHRHGNRLVGYAHQYHRCHRSQGDPRGN